METIRRGLEPHLGGRVLERVRILHPHVTGPRPGRDVARDLAGRRVIRLWRRGKYLVLDLEGTAAHPRPAHLVCHLRMTGRLTYLAPGARWREAAAHTHAALHLEGGGRVMFHDVRKFGRLLLVPPGELSPLLPRGRDPLVDGLDGADLALALAGRRSSLKALLLRQDLVAGLGNIYADEALHRAGLHPARRGGSLDGADCARLALAIHEVLGEALAAGGTTLLDYRDSAGRPGGFRVRLRVYGQAGRSCPSCGATIQARQLAGRTTAFCPRCQPDCV